MILIMSNSIKMSLSSASIERTIEKINKLKELMSEAKRSGVEEVLEGAYEVIVLNTPIDTGETVASTLVEINSGKAKITQTGDHVFENEFGDGNLAGDYPGERPSNFPIHSGEYSFVPTNPSSKYYEWYLRKGRPLVSQGQMAHAQMYQGSQYIRNNISNIIKKKVSGALSKI